MTTVNHRDPSSAKRLRRMHDSLVAAYGPQHWWPAETSFEVVLGAYLTQNTAWKAVELSLANLRKAGALSIGGIRAIPLSKLRRLIRPSGFFTRKAPALKAFVRLLDDKYSGSLTVMAAVPTEELRRRLLQLPGVGQETADAILLYALGHALPVGDEYLRRITQRHGLLTPRKGRRHTSYDQLADLIATCFCRRPGLSTSQTIQ
jgi:endonuclease III related protein